MIRLSPRELMLEDPSLVSQFAAGQAKVGCWSKVTPARGLGSGSCVCACLAGSLFSWRELSIPLARQPCPPACQMPANDGVFIFELQSTL